MKLFKKDSKGKIRVREIWTEGDKIYQSSGLEDGKKVEVVSTSTPKNVGRSNETSGQKQAILEMESKVKNKLDKGYFRTKEEVENNKVMLPMLAMPYKKAMKHIDYTCHNGVRCEPKYDGMRLFATVKDGKCVITSRTGKVIDTLQHLNEQFTRLGDGIYDGEGYLHGEEFQNIMSLIKRKQEGTENVCFYMYDIVLDKSYNKRRAIMLSLPLPSHIILSKCERVYDELKFKELHEKFIGQGYEGTIIRHGHRGYKLDNRHKQLIKYKDFMDEMFELVDIIPMDKRQEQGKAIMITKSGHTFTGNFKLSHEKRKEMLKNKEKYIGMDVECRFFEWTTSDNPVPRFPVVHMRLDK